MYVTLSVCDVRLALKQGATRAKLSMPINWCHTLGRMACTHYSNLSLSTFPTTAPDHSDLRWRSCFANMLLVFGR